MVETALVIRPEWLELILAGQKIWELRSRPHKQTRLVALAEMGGPLVAVCTIGESIPLRKQDYAPTFRKHRATRKQIREFFGNKQVYAWPLEDIEPLNPPIKYKHPGGGSWVKLSAENVPEFDRLQGG